MLDESRHKHWTHFQQIVNRCMCVIYALYFKLFGKHPPLHWFEIHDPKPGSPLFQHVARGSRGNNTQILVGKSHCQPRGKSDIQSFPSPSIDSPLPPFCESWVFSEVVSPTLEGLFWADHWVCLRAHFVKKWEASSNDKLPSLIHMYTSPRLRCPVVKCNQYVNSQKITVLYKVNLQQVTLVP